MVETIYSFLESVGFGHPLHPMLTHAPMGMIIGMVAFGLFGLLWNNDDLFQSAYYCSVLALLSILPVIGAGVMDWLHYLEGEWNVFIIIKLILGALLTLLLIVSVTLKNSGAEKKTLLLFYFLCLACAGGLGYSGGELVYG